MHRRRGACARHGFQAVEGLSHLQAAEFLYETSLFPTSSALQARPTYDVAYGSLLQDRRCALHATIVDAIETLHTERLTEHAERLAYHAVRGRCRERRRCDMASADD